MVRVVEFRICLPMSLEEYERGFVYTLAKTTQQNSKDGEGVETVENAEFDLGDAAEDPRMEAGVHALKILHLGNRAPKLVRMLTPANALMLEEESWNCFPYCKTVYRSNFFGKRFSLTVETMVLDDDRGEHPNALGLSEERLKLREVDYIDIVEDEVESEYIHSNENPSTFVSKATGRGPLAPKFYKTCKPCVCVYKVVTVNLEFGPFQKKAESLCLSAGMRDLLLPFHRQVFCWIDEWFGMTKEQTLAFERETQAKLNQMQFSTKRGGDGQMSAEASVALIKEEDQAHTPASMKQKKK